MKLTQFLRDSDTWNARPEAHSGEVSARWRKPSEQNCSCSLVSRSRLARAMLALLAARSISARESRLADHRDGHDAATRSHWTRAKRFPRWRVLTSVTWMAELSRDFYCDTYVRSPILQ